MSTKTTETIRKLDDIIASMEQFRERCEGEVLDLRAELETAKSAYADLLVNSGQEIKRLEGLLDAYCGPVSFAGGFVANGSLYKRLKAQGCEITEGGGVKQSANSLWEKINAGIRTTVDDTKRAPVNVNPPIVDAAMAAYEKHNDELSKAEQLISELRRRLAAVEAVRLEMTARDAECEKHKAPAPRPNYWAGKLQAALHARTG